MNFFFVRDDNRRYRYFSSEPLRPPQIKLSKPKEAWDLAKKKLMVLPYRTLRQEQAFERALKFKQCPLPIIHSGLMDGKKIKLHFTVFLQKQRTAHTLILVCEGVLLPLSGLAAVFPGPNILFYALALLMVTQWQALRGIRRTLKAEHLFIPDALLASWESAVHDGRQEGLTGILSSIEKKHGVPDIAKILWTKKSKRP